MLKSGPRLDACSPSAGLLVQFLAWVAARPRTYAEAMEAWRTSCPKLSVWEDAAADGLVRLQAEGTATQGEAAVQLTETGFALLAQMQRPESGTYGRTLRNALQSGEHDTSGTRR